MLKTSLQVSLLSVAVYLDFKLDESYTPLKLSVRAGTSFHDLREVATHEFAQEDQPTGWTILPMKPANSRCVCQPVLAVLLAA